MKAMSRITLFSLAAAMGALAAPAVSAGQDLAGLLRGNYGPAGRYLDRIQPKVKPNYRQQELRAARRQGGKWARWMAARSRGCRWVERPVPVFAGGAFGSDDKGIARTRRKVRASLAA